MPDMTTLARWTRGLAVLAKDAPPRLSASQLIAFAVAAVCDIAGRPTSMTDLQDTLGPVARGSIKTTYAIFLPPTPRRPEGLGWIMTTAHPLDMRKRQLCLTPKGKRIVRRMLAASGCDQAEGD